jgi:hypothetical protein
MIRDTQFLHLIKTRPSSELAGAIAIPRWGALVHCKRYTVARPYCRGNGNEVVTRCRGGLYRKRRRECSSSRVHGHRAGLGHSAAREVHHLRSV